MLKDKWVKTFYRNLGIDIIEDNLPNYYNMNKEDFNTFGGYYEDFIKIYPLFDKKIFSGDIYLLVDNRTYSSSEAFAQFSKYTKFAVLVGKKTGGDGYNGGTPILTEMPNSGLIFFYRIGYGVNEDGSSNVEYGTNPDYYSLDEDSTLFTCLKVIQNKKNYNN